MRLLVSYFEPFGGEQLNPSREVGRELDRRSLTGVEWHCVELPVERNTAFERLLAVWRGEGDRSRPGYDVWLGLGQAGGRSEICVEARAQNRFAGTAAAPDADPEGSATARPLVADAPAAYDLRWPSEPLARALSIHAPRLRHSRSAGTFVCNEVLFRMEHHLRRSELLDQSAGVSAPSGGAGPGGSDGLPRWAGFLHLPYLPAQVSDKAAVVSRAGASIPPSLALDLQLDVVLRAIAWLRDARLASAPPEQPNEG